MSNGYDRRSFVKKLGASGLGIALFAREIMGQAADSAVASAKKIRNYKPGMKYRLVGSTGMYISAFSIGTTRGELRRSREFGTAGLWS